MRGHRGHPVHQHAADGCTHTGPLAYRPWAPGRLQSCRLGLHSSLLAALPTTPRIPTLPHRGEGLLTACLCASFQSAVQSPLKSIG